MKILIYTTHRTGSTSLAQLLMHHYECMYQREGFFRNQNFDKIIEKIDNIIIKLTPGEIEYNLVRNKFDKCIVITRNDIQKQAESRLYADKVKKYFSPYKIENEFLEKNKAELTKMIQIIKTENEVLKRCDDCLQITYEELYYSNGLERIANYLNTEFKLTLDNSKKYRDSVKSLI